MAPISSVHVQINNAIIANQPTNAAVNNKNINNNIITNSATNGTESTESTNTIHSILPFNSIVRNSPFLINNNNQRRNTFNGSVELDRYKKQLGQSPPITSQVKEYCDKNNSDRMIRYHNNNNYNTYINKRKSANKNTKMSIITAHSNSCLSNNASLDVIQMISTSNLNDVNKYIQNNNNNRKNSTHGSNMIAAPSYTYSNSNLQDDDLLNIDVKSLVSECFHFFNFLTFLLNKCVCS